MTNETQHLLLQAIFSEPSDEVYQHLNLSESDPGLAIYRRNLQATALNALKITFPTVTQLIGEQLMGLVSSQLLVSQPPNDGDWAKWGKGLAEHLKTLDVLSEYPFVADCAALDYLCHQLVRAPNTKFNQASLMLLESETAESITVVLARSVQLLESEYPIVDIRAIHQLAEAQRTEKLAILANQPEQARYYAIAFRLGHEVIVKSLSEYEYQWFNLLKTHTLGDALSQMDLDKFNFEQWLIESLQNNLIDEFTLR